MNWKSMLKKASIYLLYGLGAVILIQDYSLRQTVDSLRHPKPGVAVGTPLKHLSGVTVDGRYREVSEKELSNALVVTFTPGCHFCDDQQSKWAEIAAAIRNKPDWHVLWLTSAPLAMTQAYAEKKSIPLTEVLCLPPAATYTQLNMRSVPTTILVKDGVIAQQWFGTLHDNDWSALQAAVN